MLFGIGAEDDWNAQFFLEGVHHFALFAVDPVHNVGVAVDDDRLGHGFDGHTMCELAEDLANDGFLFFQRA